MTVQFDTKLISSILLFIDHEILKHGRAFSNHSGRLYPITGGIQGLYAYAAPFKPLCNDTSITGATVMTGVYLNGNYVSVGQSGLHSINHNQGTAYFTGSLPSSTIVSGNYAIREFGVKMTDKPEYKLLFETKYLTNTKHNQVLSGLPLDTETSPIVYVRTDDSENLPFAFGRVDNATVKIRVIVVADTEYQKVGVCNILRNLNTRQIPIYETLPFDRNGAFTGINYNYDNIAVDTGYYPWILKSRVLSVPIRDDMPNKEKKMAIVDLDVSTVMTHF